MWCRVFMEVRDCYVGKKFHLLRRLCLFVWLRFAGKKALKCDLWITDSAAHKSRHEEMLILSRNVLPAYIIQSALFRRPANVPRLPIVAPRSL